MLKGLWTNLLMIQVLAWDLYNEPGITGISSHDISKERAIELYKKIGVEITDENYSSYNLSKIDPKSIKKPHSFFIKKIVNWVRESNPSHQLQWEYTIGTQIGLP